MRRKGDELHLITFGRYTYSSDSRYTLEYKEPNDWQLNIQYANERDEGHYECQISSHPPLVFIAFLTVVGKKSVLRVYGAHSVFCFFLNGRSAKGEELHNFYCIAMFRHKNWPKTESQSHTHTLSELLPLACDKRPLWCTIKLWNQFQAES